MKGVVIAGKYGEVLIRQKHDVELEIGEMLIAETSHCKILLQVTDLIYGSQISQTNLEFISGMKIEQGEDVHFIEEELSNYTLAVAKSILSLGNDGHVKAAKILPHFFSEVREVQCDDFSFLEKPSDSIYLGELRSGSKTLNVPIYLNGRDVLSHHILIPATTGRGKSNLLSVILHDAAPKDFCGMLVLDPHDEYYAKLKGLENVMYYSSSGERGTYSLKINVGVLKPHHFQGAFELTGPQKDAMYAYYRKFGDTWIDALLLEKNVHGSFMDSTLGVLSRKFSGLLDAEIIIDEAEIKTIRYHGTFTKNGATSTLKDICRYLEDAQCVIVDTSSFHGASEILIGSLIISEVYEKYKQYNCSGALDSKPVISIVLEEAPRVLGKEVLERGPNIFSTIAREGRKFKVGLIAVTQLPSLIPRTVLANMNTKIILGLEMGPERQAIIDSASQDLSSDNRNIASLDKGESIVSSNFGKFAIPVKIPLFSEYVKNGAQEKCKPKASFSGVKLS